MEGSKLYRLDTDPGQKQDIAAQHPDVVAELKADYEVWWKSLEQDRKQIVRLGIGGKENPTTLYSHDWFMPAEELSAWHQNQIRKGSLINGPWNVRVEQAGRYKIQLFRWAPYLRRKMDQVKARLKVADFDSTIDLAAGATSADFELVLDKGNTQLQSWLYGDQEQHSGAYYVKVEFLGPSNKP